MNIPNVMTYTVQVVVGIETERGPFESYVEADVEIHASGRVIVENMKYTTDGGDLREETIRRIQESLAEAALEQYGKDIANGKFHGGVPAPELDRHVPVSAADEAAIDKALGLQPKDNLVSLADFRARKEQKRAAPKTPDIPPSDDPEVARAVDDMYETIKRNIALREQREKSRLAKNKQLIREQGPKKK